MLHQTSTVRSSSTVPLEVQTWKAQVKQLSEPEAEFEKWLLVTLAGVLFADKAGELLALQPRQFGASSGAITIASRSMAALCSYPPPNPHHN